MDFALIMGRMVSSINERRQFSFNGSNLDEPFSAIVRPSTHPGIFSFILKTSSRTSNSLLGDNMADKLSLLLHALLNKKTSPFFGALASCCIHWLSTLVNENKAQTLFSWCPTLLQSTIGPPIPSRRCPCEETTDPWLLRRLR